MKLPAPGALPVSVKPRKYVHDERPIIAFCGDWIAVERTGEIRPASDLLLTLVLEPPSILVCERASAVLADLNQTSLAAIPGWQYRVAPVERRIYTAHRRTRPTTVLDVTVAFFGWRFIQPKGNGKRERVIGTHYHYPLDPVIFSNQPIRKLVTVDEQQSRVVALLQWGLDVRTWCHENGVKVTSGSGSLAVALLKDSRFYPVARRKVPRATNDKARPHLPGNHYELFVPPRRYYNGVYLDMTSAHHSCAATLRFPSANSLLARGSFRDNTDAPRWRRDSPSFSSLMSSHGLLRITLSVPRLTDDKFPPPYMKEPGRKVVHVYTNEVPTIQALGGDIEGIHAAWTSWEVDTGLNRYAVWSLHESADMSEARKRWAKPILLAGYGMLAARPAAHTFGYHDAKGGTEDLWMTPHGPLPVRVKTQEREIETSVANVIHRGMIEAEVRAQALALARDLHSRGVRVLCIYADSIIVSADSQLPILPWPWRVKTELNRLQFFTPTSFASQEMTRLPGIPEGAQRLTLSRMMAAATAERFGPLGRKRRHIRAIRGE